jgi:pyruvate/2-oxoacid:ferredoxin oxidoreductase alpha subunit
MERRPEVYSVIAGLGGRDVTPRDVSGIIDHMSRTEQSVDEPVFWGLKQ